MEHEMDEDLQFARIPYRHDWGTPWECPGTTSLRAMAQELDSIRQELGALQIRLAKLKPKEEEDGNP
jgi:hypothetical protein